MAEVEVVYLTCVKVANKLRVRITSPGYLTSANCSFPRSIRAEGAIYSVPKHAVKLSEKAGMKFFYHINKNYVTVLSNISSQPQQRSDEKVEMNKIFEDDNEECIICFDKPKNTVFFTCGHYNCCNECASMIFNTKKSCPMCRTKILKIVPRENVI